LSSQKTPAHHHPSARRDPERSLHHTSRIWWKWQLAC
jgi:hypothetical protein